MKKIASICALALMVLACSVSDVTNLLTPPATPVPAALPTETAVVTPSDTPTITATLPTPTFTETPTLLGAESFTETPAPSSTATTSIAIPTSGGSSLLTPQYVGFTSVAVSGTLLKWGGCEPSSITFIARVADPVQVVSVTLWVRLKNDATGESTGWETGAIMKGDKTGTYTYTLTPKNVSHFSEYPTGWLQYQLVGVNGSFKHIAWTEPYLNSIAISRCS